MRTLAAVVLLIGLPASAGADHRGFTYGDTILLPRITANETDPDWLARCDYLIRGAESHLEFGYVIEIPAPYNDGRHAFSLVDGLMGSNVVRPADFDVTFAPGLGTCSANLEDATRFFNVGEERGVVPAGTRYAIITMRSIETPTATFYIEIPPIG